MPSRKKLSNQQKGNLGEEVTQREFGLRKTSGSGRGFSDKLDSKDDWIRCETKATGKDYYTVEIAKFEGWRLQAARDRKQFFLHVIPEREGTLDFERSLVVVEESFLKALPELPDDPECTWALGRCYEFPEVSTRIRFDEFEDYNFKTIEVTLVTLLQLNFKENNLVALRAPWFRYLLRKEDESN